MLSCKKCITRGKFFPISNDWILEPRNGYVLSPDHVFVVDVTHVAANVSPSWQDVDQREKLNSLVVKMPDRLRMNDEDGWTNQLQVLSTAELETIARKLNISEPSRTESYRDQLLQRLAHGGPVRALLHVISQVSPSQGNHVSDASSLHPEGYPVSPDRPQSSARTINTNGASADEAGPDSETQRKCIRCSGSHDTGYGIQETYGLPGPVSQESSLSSMVTSDITEPKKAFSYRRENDARDEAQRILDRGPLLSRTSFSSFLQNADAMSENCGSPHQLNNMGSIPSSDFKRETQARLWQQQADGQTNGRLLRNHKETIDGGDGMEDYFRELEK
ncbi:uncharacterized protein LOC143282432 [Babylonia areolata]|uniref:uncharacterized protein LOC143282432 n=1 Tax=Babylonia areolata TaxID=304850 RepID=UPI003FD6291E